jgi:uncharacterized protein YgiM (DUF1202 family)
MTTVRMKQALALGAAILTLSAGGAFAATTDSSVNVMTGPGSHYKTIASLPAGDNVTLAKKSGSWCDISAPATGWVPCGDLNGVSTKTAAATPASTSGWNGYEWQNDNNLGPAGMNSIHQMYGGSFD